MPDWFYRTVAQRGLFQLGDATARRVALGVIGQLGRTAAGRGLIDFLGHMEADLRLETQVAGLRFPSPIGLGWRVDPERRASLGLARFGVGCLEFKVDEARSVARGDGETLRDGDATPGASPQVRLGALGRPALFRHLSPDRATERIELSPGVHWPVYAHDEPPGDGRLGSKSGVALQVGTKLGDGRWEIPTQMPADLPTRVRAWRERLGPDATILVSGGIADPDDAVILIEAGADLLLVEAGLIFRGPGLIKRCNEALMSRRAGPALPPKVGLPRRSWAWAAVLALALAGGGALTLVLALTRVLLPYDENYLGLTAESLRRNSPRLFAFMAHDRGTLAGTMLGLGWLYGMIAWGAIRRGVHGAKNTIVASALVGFASFFSFLGFGYFDALHAFVSAILFQLTVQVMVGTEGGAAEVAQSSMPRMPRGDEPSGANSRGSCMPGA